MTGRHQPLNKFEEASAKCFHVNSDADISRAPSGAGFDLRFAGGGASMKEFEKYAPKPQEVSQLIVGAHIGLPAKPCI